MHSNIIKKIQQCIACNPIIKFAEPKEMKAKKYRHVTLEQQESQEVTKTVTQWEACLSEYNHMTISSDRFKGYIKSKLLVNSKGHRFLRMKLSESSGSTCQMQTVLIHRQHRNIIYTG